MRFRGLPHDVHISLLALLAGLPGAAVAMALLWRSEYSQGVQWAVTLLVLGVWIGLAIAVRRRVARPLRTMGDLLAALREGDFSIRARHVRHKDPLSGVMGEINTLGSILQEQRLGALEAAALLRTVMEEIEVAIFAFDSDGVLRLVNRAGQQLIGRSPEDLVGRPAAEIGLADMLRGQPARLLDTAAFPRAARRWGMRRTTFREQGHPHVLVVVADLSKALREQELQAWQRLVRVLGHELNNSLAPIKSIAGSLGSLLERKPPPPDWEEDMRSGLDIIATRADGLARFLHAYTRLARLPAPIPARCDLPTLIHRVVALERRLPITIEPGPELAFSGDAAQIEQVLINLVGNAAEAALESRTTGRNDAGVRLRWRQAEASVEIEIEDDGPGIAQTANLFVPFFTTKPQGSGIGLVLCRQIAENHGGTLDLSNRAGASGCSATLRLPL